MDAPRDGIKTTTCYMCACRCGIREAVRWLFAEARHPQNLYYQSMA